LTGVGPVVRRRGRALISRVGRGGATRRTTAPVARAAGVSDATVGGPGGAENILAPAAGGTGGGGGFGWRCGKGVQTAGWL